MILIGVREGPRLGPYIAAMERENVVNALCRVLERYKTNNRRGKKDATRQ